ncbi:unnamed protein product [Auanema sp. JU1783]|nr:unnamed protein product [Auanema sp. JU1783]
MVGHNDYSLENVSYRLFIHSTHVPVLSWKTTFFIQFPEHFTTLAKNVKDSPCASCGKLNYAPILCIICGQCICEKHLMNPEVQTFNVDFRTRDHRCQAGYGAFLSLQTADLIVTTSGHGAVYGKLYVNEYGEETPVVCSELYFVEQRLRNFEEDFVLCHYISKSFLVRDYFVAALQTTRITPSKLSQYITSIF